MNLRRVDLLGLLFILVTALSISAQNMVGILMKKANGLVQNETHRIKFGPDGHVYFEHDGVGLGNYDGIKFTNTLFNQIPKGGIARKFLINSKGVQIIQSDSGLYFIHKDTIQYRNLSDYKSDLTFRHTGIDKFIHAFDKNNRIYKYMPNEDQFKETKYVLDKDNVLIDLINEYGVIYSNNDHKLIQKDLKGNEKVMSKFNNYTWPSYNIFINEENYYHFIGNQLEKFPLNDLIKKEHRINKPPLISSDSTSGYILISSEIGQYHIYEYDKLNFKIKSKSSFKIQSYVADFIRDEIGSYWMATSDGILRCFPWLLFISNEQKKMVPELHTISEDSKGNIWFGSHSFGYCYFDGETTQKPNESRLENLSVLPGSYKDNSGYTWQSGILEGKTQVWKMDGEKITPIHENIQGFYFQALKNGLIAFGTGGEGLWLFEKDKLIEKIDKSKGLGLDNILTISEDHFSRIWMARNSQGISYYDPIQDTVINFLISEKEDFGAMSSVVDSRGGLWFGGAKGLFYFPSTKTLPTDFKPGKYFKSMMSEYFKDNMVSMLKLYNQDSLIIAGPNTVMIFDLKTFYESNMESTHYFCFDPRNSLSQFSPDQNSILIDSKKQIWIGGDEGALCIDLKKLKIPEKNKISPEIHLMYNQTEIFASQKSKYELENFMQIIDIYFTRDSRPLLYSQLFIKYRLNGGEWNISNDSKIKITNLKNRNNILEFKTMVNGQESEIQQLHLYLKVELAKQPWFWLLIASIGFGFISLLLHLRAKANKDKLQMQLQLETQRKERTYLQIQSLVNQLNPHFINNALQWVQVRVFKDTEAVDVIGKLAENIKIVFQNSIHKRVHHSLREELVLVRNYLDIQQKRFGNKLQYTIPEESELETVQGVHVFLMCCQIHVENAVEHGLRNKEGEGKVSLQIEDQELYIHITIEDDGIGRKKAALIKSRGTQRGTKMLEDLRDIYNSVNTLHVKFEIEDDIWNNEAHGHHGTRIHLYFPKEYNFNLD